MRHDDFDQKDDAINPLAPWRSVALVFIAAWMAVLLDALDVPGRHGGRPGFDPIFLALPFLAVAGYWAFWMVWRVGQRRHQRRSRERRTMLGHDRPH
jgi:hypothetical protein